MSRIAAEPFTPLHLDGARTSEGFIEERLEYRVKPALKTKFNTVLDARDMFGPDGCTSILTTRLYPDAGPGDVIERIEAEHELRQVRIIETLECERLAGGASTMRAGKFQRVLRDHGDEVLRHEQAYLGAGIKLPTATYPDVLIPLLMRGQPRDRKRRATYSWTSDRFVARVYYESRRKKHKLSVPAGRYECAEVWMYPDLNDWISLGGMLTKLAKPFLPRYTMYFSLEAPYELVRFEGPYGPPGAPEVVLELAATS